MVVKSSSAPSSPAAPEIQADPLRGVSRLNNNNDGHINKHGSNKETDLEFCRLKNLVPAISKKQSVSKLDVILEAIRYIDQLQDQLVEQINERKISVAATALLVGKENKDLSKLMACAKRQRRSSQ